MDTRFPSYHKVQFLEESDFINRYMKNKTMYLFLYKTTNIVNNNFYIGVHKTKNLDDGYLGSGSRFLWALKKYGRENFKREILEFFEIKEEMFARESEIVNEEFVKREDTYNLKTGGQGYGGEKGGRMSWAKRPEERKQKDRERWIKQGITNCVTYAKSEKNREAIKNYQPLAVTVAASKEAIEKRKKTFQERKHSQKEKNPQWGKIWIKNLFTNESKMIQPNEQIPEGWVRGRIWKTKK